MKTVKPRLPITLDDLEATAKDAKDGWCNYYKLYINWNGKSFSYWFDDRSTTKLIAGEYLKERRIWG